MAITVAGGKQPDRLGSRFHRNPRRSTVERKMSMRTQSAVAVLVLSALCGSACSKSTETSRTAALDHTEYVAKAVETDVAEVQRGLPEGAKHLTGLFASATPPAENLTEVREALDTARSKVQDLRVAKSTFFALVDLTGQVLRNDQEQDAMAGKNVFASFPGLKAAAPGKVVETHGSMPEAARVKGEDGQWVAATPVVVEGKARALYVTGWAWSAYAYRLENALRGDVRSSLPERKTLPLIYVYMVVADRAYGAPVSPLVNASAIAEHKPLEKLDGEGRWSTTLEITGRGFGLAVRRLPALGPGVAVAVLRTET